MSEYSPADVLAQHFIDENISSNQEDDLGWPQFVNHMPEKGNEAVCVYDTTARKQGRIQATGETITQPTIQIRIRANTHPEGWKKGSEIEQAMDAVKRTVVNMGDATLQ